MQTAETLYMVIPCYNEEAVLHETAARLKEKYTALREKGMISAESRIVFVNDGSKDQTWQIISELHASAPDFFSGINLAHNAGHQNAVLAGLMTVKEQCDMAISMDADLQDDINAIDEMVAKYYEGNQVVYGVRSARDTDTFFKKFTAEGFYKFMSAMGADVVYNHADFRLMSRRVLQELGNFREVNLFLRGMVPLIGFQSCNVYYERAELVKDYDSNIKPLRMITTIGLLMFLLSAAAFVWAFIVKLTGHSELGWSSTMCSIWLIGGLQLLALGIIGEYIGKIYAEVKQRPRYIVAEYLNTGANRESGTE